MDKSFSYKQTYSRLSACVDNIKKELQAACF